MTAIVKKPEKGLAIKLDELVIPKHVTGTQADDPILKFASQIENKTRTEVEEIIKNLSNARAFGRFQLGGAVARLHALFDKAKSEFAGYKNFREYVEAALGIGYSNAMRAAEIYEDLLALGIPWSSFENIGWTKVLLLLDVVTKCNVKEWVAKAKEMNFPSLKAHVEAEKRKGKAGTEPAPKMITSKTFQLHEDQKEIVEAAREKIKEESGTAVDSVALEYMAQNHLGAGIQFQNWDQALTYAINHQGDRTLFVQQVITRLEELCPDLEINVEITSKKSAAAA